MTSGAWSGSDERWKKNIVTLNNSLDKIMRLRGVSHEWRVDEFPELNFINGTQLGLIAQEAELVVPEVVTTGEDGFKGISYEKLVPVLIEAVKELKVEGDELRVENEEMLRRLEILENG